MAAEAALGAAVQVLLQNLISFSTDQISLVRGFEKDLKKLKESVVTIQDLLDDAENKQIKDKAVKRWLKKLEAVAFDADNVLDELNYLHLSKNIQPQYKMKKKVRCFFPQCVPDARRLKMARKIKDINKNLEEINQQARTYGLQKTLTCPHASVTVGSGPSAGLETDSFSIDPIFCGRENDVPEIVKMMTTLPNDQVLSILPIVGMAGLGKSTVARHVFHEVIKIKHFDKHLWVHVSENFDVVILFKKILTSLTQSNVELGNKQALLENIQTQLNNKKFLLVLDDVWNENQEIWDDFIHPLRIISSRTGGNGIIVTTRSETVSSVVRTFPAYKLKDLPDDECWSVIKAKAFRQGIVPSEFETIGVSIAKRCKGLPLAAKVVGGLLRGKSIDEWISIEKNWLTNSENENNTVSNVLKLSYDHLSSQSLKKCFAYCSVFPKGFNMEREKMVELWMAEGFLGGNDDMENVGNKFFSLLLENSLLQVVERNVYYGNRTYYNMHDLVHDLASSVSNPKMGNVWDKAAYQLRYVSLRSVDVETSHILKEQARYLRTLHFNGKVRDITLSDFKCLRALIIVMYGVEWNVEELSSIGKLIHLRCLDISGTSFRCLPDSIGELYYLQTLRAGLYLKKVPNTLNCLTSLRHLHIPPIELPQEMGRLTSLRTLPYFGVGDEKGCGIGELGSLKDLQGDLKIYNLEKVHDKEEAMSADLLQKPHIVKLTLEWSFGNREGQNGDESVLEGLQPHPNLSCLMILRFSGKRFSSWSSKMSGLNNLMEIKLVDCKQCEQVPTMGHLPNLKSLYLEGLVNVRTIGSSFYGIDDNFSSTSCSRASKNTLITVFPALERLELIHMLELRDWLEAELPNAVADNDQLLMAVFPRLEYLEVRSCEKLETAPSHFPCLKELVIADVNSELPLASICGIELLSLTKLEIESIDGLMCLPYWLFNKNKNLRELVIRECHNLTHLVPRLEGVEASLRDLSIRGCMKLKELPGDLNSLKALERLTIIECPSLETIPYPHEIIESCAPSLEIVTLKGLPNLSNMEMVIQYCLNKMPRLSSLTVFDVPITITPNSSFSSLNGSLLRYLCISTSCDDDSNSVVDAILKASTKSLKILSLQGTTRDEQSSGHLPDQIQHLTALSDLWLHGLGNIQELPEWFGNNNNFSSCLQVLDLFYCKRLRHLPSKEAMKRLTNLTCININHCPLLNLKKVREGEDDYDSEWHKISHIPTIRVEG